MSHSFPDPREITLEGSLNFRDLGGMETRTGARIRHRTLFRSDALHLLTQRDMATLAEYGVVTLVDLRGADEIERTGQSPLTGSGTRVAHAPLLSLTPESPAPDFTVDLDVDYANLLNFAHAGLVKVFGALAEESSFPAVIHCASGKDRTGVTVALLLRVLDVPDEAIALDYAITDRNMARILARDPENAARFPDHWHRAIPETMLRFLAKLDAQYGSVDHYLQGAGVTPGQISAIRDRLLENS